MGDRGMKTRNLEKSLVSIYSLTFFMINLISLN